MLGAEQEQRQRRFPRKESVEGNVTCKSLTGAINYKLKSKLHKPGTHTVPPCHPSHISSSPTTVGTHVLPLPFPRPLGPGPGIPRWSISQNGECRARGIPLRRPLNYGRRTSMAPSKATAWRQRLFASTQLLPSLQYDCIRNSRVTL